MYGNAQLETTDDTNLKTASQEPIETLGHVEVKV